MPQQPQEQTRVRDFQGINTEVDAHNLPPEQSPYLVNVSVDRIGRLSSRKAVRLVKFEDD